MIDDLTRKSILEAVGALESQPNVRTTTSEEIRSEAEKYGYRTEYNNYNFVSTIKNRSAKLTTYIGSKRIAQPKLNPQQQEILKNLPKTLTNVHNYFKRAPLTCIKLTMGDNNIFAPRCTIFVSSHRKDSIRLAYMVGQTLFKRNDRQPGPELKLVYLPEWQEKDRQILAFPEIGVTYVLGSDYYGEAKKGFLRMAMWHAKEQGMLGIHAGTKILHARDAKSGKLKRYGMIIFGLTATGKTTHACHNHGLTTNGEHIEIAQDDFNAFRPDGSCLGTERGFYVKTDGLNPESQALLYRAATSPDAILENVMVDYRGKVGFSDETLTGNGRCIIQKKDLGECASSSPNVPPISEMDGLIIAFITRRNTVVHIASKLTLQQAAAAFMLGESIESSGGDPKRAGESVREVGTNPFIVGDFAEEGNIFYNFIKTHPDKIQCYLLNTGGVGEIREKNPDGTSTIKQKVLRVEIPEMASIIRGIARGSIQWAQEPHFGTLVPASVEGVDMNKFNLTKFYSSEQIETYVRTLNKERTEYLRGFVGLDKEIVEAVK